MEAAVVVAAVGAVEVVAVEVAFAVVVVVGARLKLRKKNRENHGTFQRKITLQFFLKHISYIFV